MSVDPSQFNLVQHFLGNERLHQIGDLIAVEFRDSRVTYSELRSKVDQWARLIVNRGVNEGDRVALLLYDSPEFIACFLATLSVGAVCVPINTFLPASDVAFILADSGARLLIVESELDDKVNLSRGSQPGCNILKVDTPTRSCSERGDDDVKQQARAATTRESPAFILYTSGSTGAPKGVLHLHGSIPHTVGSYCKSILRLTNQDRVYSSSRLFFAYGLGNSLSFPVAAGATVILDSARATPERIATLFEEQAPTVFFGVPAAYLSLLEHCAKGGALNTSKLRLCVSAGEALPARIFEDWQREVGLTILDGIGSTEMLHIFISNREGKARPGSSGTIVPGYAARLVDDQASDVEELGDLWVRGSSATAGYWNRPELTRETIQNGWVRTGDIYRCERDGFFYHVGRSDDCFKVRGLWVSPIEVEGALLAHDSVVEAAVVSAVDKDGLATAKAYVVIRAEKQDGLKNELIGFVGSRLASYKAPSQIEFIDEMPRTATGKIQRFKLRGPANSSGEIG
ncbi:MAG: benzoate-CoA ligase family protein [Blastocatellia bacterium]